MCSSTALRSLCTLLVVGCPAVSASASQTIWVADQGGFLATVDSVTGVPTFVGHAGTQLTDIAFDPSGNLWGVGGPDFTYLFTVDTATGVATPVGDMGVPVNSLIFGSDGTLYGAYADLMIIDTTTAAITVLGPTGFQAAGDLAFHDGTLYMSAMDPGGYESDVLVALDTGTGAGTVIGGFGMTGIMGLASGTDGVLYGGIVNNIVTIDTITGAASPLSSWPIFNGSFGSVYGMDIPVFEPTSALLIGLGTALWPRRRKP